MFTTRKQTFLITLKICYVPCLIENIQNLAQIQRGKLIFHEINGLLNMCPPIGNCIK